MLSWKCFALPGAFRHAAQQQQQTGRRIRIKRRSRRSQKTAAAAAAAALDTSLEPASSLLNLPILANASPVAVNGGLVVATLVLSYLWVKLFDLLASKEIFERNTSRKLVHITTGPLFLATWPLYAKGAGVAVASGSLADALLHPQVIVCLVPAFSIIRLALIGTGVMPSKNTLRAVSRSGDRTELLRGPLFYSVCLAVLAGVFWRESPTALVAMSVLCIGDGLADVVGRRLGKGNPLPFNRNKSYAGSIAMMLGAFLGSLAFAYVFVEACGIGIWTGAPGDGILDFAVKSLAICATSALVEALPINAIIDDNISVPVVAIFMSRLCFGR